MESDFERFRIDPTVRDQAARVCVELGHELSDVLRALVTRIATDGAIPFSMLPAQPASPTDSFMDRDPRLWSPLQPEIEAQLALDVLGRFIADCSLALDQCQADGGGDAASATRLDRARAEAREVRRQLNVTDRAAVRAVLAKYGALLRSGPP